MRLAFRISTTLANDFGTIDFRYKLRNKPKLATMIVSFDSIEIDLNRMNTSHLIPKNTELPHLPGFYDKSWHNLKGPFNVEHSQ